MPQSTPHYDSRRNQARAALLTNAKSRDQPERLLAAQVEHDSNRAAIVNELIAFFDGPQQREPALGEDA